MDEMMEVRTFVLLLCVLARCSCKVPLPHRTARLGHQTSQLNYQPPGEQLTWRFPADPVEQQKKAPVYFPARRPATPQHVVVTCGESTVRVEVKQDPLGLGTLLDPDEVSLGGCPAKQVLQSVLIFESELHTCGSTLEVGDHGFVYVFQLVYKPRRLGPIVRSQSANIRVECRYQN